MRRRPSPALVISIISLIVACSGTAVAASLLITKSSQIRNGIITASKIHRQTLTGAQVKNRSLSGNELSLNSVGGSAIRKGTIGSDKLTSDARAALQGGGSTAKEYARKSGPDNVTGGESQRVATGTDLEPGVYAIFAKTIISDLTPDSNLLNPGDVADAHCILDAGGDQDHGREPVRSPFSSTPATVMMQITHTFSGKGSVSISCDSKNKWRASDTSIIAIRLGSSPRVEVNG